MSTSADEVLLLSPSGTQQQSSSLPEHLPGGCPQQMPELVTSTSYRKHVNRKDKRKTQRSHARTMRSQRNTEEDLDRAEFQHQVRTWIKQPVEVLEKLNIRPVKDTFDTINEDNETSQKEEAPDRQQHHIRPTRRLNLGPPRRILKVDSVPEDNIDEMADSSSAEDNHLETLAALERDQNALNMRWRELTRDQQSLHRRWKNFVKQFPKPKSVSQPRRPLTDEGNIQDVLPENQQNTEEDTPVTVGAQNTEECFLGNPNNLETRISVPIKHGVLMRINSTSKTPDSMALRLMDCLFSRATQAVSNVTGCGKLKKHALNPRLVQAIKGHVSFRFPVTNDDWNRIKKKITIKCIASRKRQNEVKKNVKFFCGKDS